MGKQCNLRKRRREVLIRVQGGLCAYCFKPMDPPKIPGSRVYNPRAASMDEVVPRSRGGRHAANTVAAHEFCNVRKDNRLPTGCELIALAWVNARLVEESVFVTDRLALGLPGPWKKFKHVVQRRRARVAAMNGAGDKTQ